MNVTVVRKSGLFGGLMVLLASIALFFGANAVGAATGGQNIDEGPGDAFQQGTTDGGTLSYVSSLAAGVSVVTCADDYCNSSSFVEIDELLNAEGYDVANGNAFISGRDDNLQQVIVTCSNPSCVGNRSVSPAPAVGKLFALGNGGFLIVDRGNTIHACNQANCATANRTGTLPAGARDVAVTRSNLPVVLTSTSIIRCANAVCSQIASQSSHGLTGVRSLDVGSDNLPVIGLAIEPGDDSFVPALAHCENAGCTSSSIERLASISPGANTVQAVAGNPDLGVRHGRFGTTVLVSSPLTCSAVWDGQNYSLTFDGTVGRSAQLRIGDRWVADVTGDTSASGSTTSFRTSVLIRQWFGQNFLDVSCFETAAGGGGGQAGGGGGQAGGTQPVGLECVAERNGNSVTLRFNNNSQSANLREGSRWIATVTGTTSFLDTTPGDSYTLIRHIDGVRSTFPCAEGGAGSAPSCTVTESQSFRPLISWSNIADGDTVVLRRNNRWLTTPSPAASSFEDPNGLIQADYSVRAWSDDNTFVDITCTR